MYMARIRFMMLITWLVMANRCDCIVLPSNETVDQLISDIFVVAASANRTQSASPPPQPADSDTICIGRCVPVLQSSCSMDAAADNDDDGDFFDIRISDDGADVNPPALVRCDGRTEKCCKWTGKRYVELSSSVAKALVNDRAEEKQLLQCGHSRSDRTAQRVISEGAAEPAEFPWMVAIFVSQKQLQNQPAKLVYKCGGSIIHPSVVLTVAHCVHRIAATRLSIIAGKNDFRKIPQNEQTPAQEPQQRAIQKVIVHAAFNQSRFALHNDIALLMLDAPLLVAGHVRSVCLPPAGAGFDRNRCVVSGWGKNAGERQEQQHRGGRPAGNRRNRRVLKKIEIPVVPRSSCERTLRTTRLGKGFRLHSSFICAGGEPGRDACTGDGGSPLVCPIDDGAGGGRTDRFVQVGIVAVGIGCGNHIPGVYVNVPAMRQWIDKQMMRHGFAQSFYVA